MSTQNRAISAGAGAAMSHAPDNHDEVVRPSTIIRRIIGRERLPGFVKRRNSSSSHFGLIG